MYLIWIQSIGQKINAIIPKMFYVSYLKLQGSQKFSTFFTVTSKKLRKNLFLAYHWRTSFFQQSSIIQFLYCCKTILETTFLPNFTFENSDFIKTQKLHHSKMSVKILNLHYSQNRPKGWPVIWSSACVTQIRGKEKTMP